MIYDFDINRNSPVPLYAQLAQSIKNKIIAGEMPYGYKLPSEGEIAEKYNMSRMTVRAALSMLVNEKHIEKLQGKGSFVCYNVNERNYQGSIDLLLNVTYSIFSSFYIMGVSEVLAQQNYRLNIHDTRDSQQDMACNLEYILENGTDGIILQRFHKSEPVSPELSAVLSRINAQGLPFVLLGSSLKDVPCICMEVDDYEGGKIAAEHLVSLGHRNCLMVGKDEFYENPLRSSGFNSVLKKNGLPSLVTMNRNPDMGQQLLDVVRKKEITAIFCYNDEIALKVMKTLLKAGINVPGDISVVGYDDTVIAKATYPQLTSVEHPKEILGQSAARRLLGLIEQSYTPRLSVELIHPKLHVRSSTGSVHSADNS